MAMSQWSFPDSDSKSQPLTIHAPVSCFTVSITLITLNNVVFDLFVYLISHFSVSASVSLSYTQTHIHTPKYKHNENGVSVYFIHCCFSRIQNSICHIVGTLWLLEYMISPWKLNLRQDDKSLTFTSQPTYLKDYCLTALMGSFLRP